MENGKTFLPLALIKILNLPKGTTWFKLHWDHTNFIVVEFNYELYNESGEIIVEDGETLTNTKSCVVSVDDYNSFFKEINSFLKLPKNVKNFTLSCVANEDTVIKCSFLSGEFINSRIVGHIIENHKVKLIDIK